MKRESDKPTNTIDTLKIVTNVRSALGAVKSSKEKEVSLVPTRKSPRLEASGNNLLSSKPLLEQVSPFLDQSPFSPTLIPVVSETLTLISNSLANEKTEFKAKVLKLNAREAAIIKREKAVGEKEAPLVSSSAKKRLSPGEEDDDDSDMVTVAIVADSGTHAINAQNLVSTNPRRGQHIPIPGDYIKLMYHMASNSSREDITELRNIFDKGLSVNTTQIAEVWKHKADGDENDTDYHLYPAPDDPNVNRYLKYWWWSNTTSTSVHKKAGKMKHLQEDGFQFQALDTWWHNLDKAAFATTMNEWNAKRQARRKWGSVEGTVAVGEGDEE